MKEIIKIEIRIRSENPILMGYLSADKEFRVYTSRAMLFRSIEAIEKKLQKIYKAPELTK